jgi:hypothetical protein
MAAFDTQSWSAKPPGLNINPRGGPNEMIEVGQSGLSKSGHGASFKRPLKDQFSITTTFCRYSAF